MNHILPFLHDLFPANCHERLVLVGGTLRDMLLGVKSRDIDLVAALPDDELLALGFRPVQATSGAKVYFKAHHLFGKIEVTQISSRADLEQDLLQRDFTVNAMAMDLSGTLIDPLHGQADLKEGRLAVCTCRSFSNDPVRILRAFRFESCGWKMAPQTAGYIEDWVRETEDGFRCVPTERFTNEMLRALAMKRPEHFFLQMIRFNVASQFLPELFRMPAIPAGPIEHHPEGDLLTHSIQVLQRVAEMSTDPVARFCALFHDLGKLSTDPALYPKHHGHDRAGFEMAPDFCNRLCLPAIYRKSLAWISRLHGQANNWEELRDSTKVKMAEQTLKSGTVEILPLVSAADKPDGPSMAGWSDAVRVARMSTAELGIDQKRLESLPAGNRPSLILQMQVKTLRRLLH